MVSLVIPKMYYRVDFKRLSEEEREAAYEWAINQDAHLPDGDGDVMMWGIPRLLEQHRWANTVWDSLTLQQQIDVQRDTAHLAIGIYQ